jgi:succinate dehydrogenase/fumarate reductase iron-sulfur protein
MPEDAMATDDVSHPLSPPPHSSGATATGLSQRTSAPNSETSWSVEVYRFDPELGPRGDLALYRVPRLDKMTVLDALVYIQRHQNRSLAFRYACRLGMCGTCTVMVNGVPRWACRTSIERLGTETIRIELLRFLPVIKDVMLDYEPFFTKYRAAQAYFVPQEEQREVAPISPASRERRAINPNLECITCGACYASCTMLAYDAEYLGPAALNRAFTLVRDSRHGARGERLAAVGGEHGGWRCHSLFNCTEVCPKHLSPNNNYVGVHAPSVDYSFEPEADWLELTVVHKGGLFGGDYRMLFPADGIPGLKRFFLDSISEFFQRGMSCQPLVVGIGIGGTKDFCVRLAKESACLRLVGDRNPESEIATLEEELLALGNSTGFGAMGFPGNGGIMDVHIEIAYTHTGGMPVAIQHFCFAHRRMTARIAADNAVTYREDPQWFTPFYRREGIE